MLLPAFIFRPLLHTSKKSIPPTRYTNQIICIQEHRKSSLLSIHIYIEKPRGHDTPSFTLTQPRLWTYMPLIPFNSLPATLYILSTCPNASLVTLSYVFSKSLKPTYILHFSHRSSSGWGYIQTSSLLFHPLFIINQTISHFIDCLLISMNIFFQPHLIQSTTFFISPVTLSILKLSHAYLNLSSPSK